MKYIMFFVTVIFSLYSLVGACDENNATTTVKHYHGSDKDAEIHNGHFCNDNTDFDIDHGTITITHHGAKKERVEITDQADLIINGKTIKIDDKQRELLADYHDHLIDITDKGMAIGLEGAKIGIEGAGVGLKAAGGVFKMFFSDYTSDDLEREVEAAAAKVEKKANKLEAKADKLEKIADELEDLQDDVCRQIPELDNLGWFCE
jgi:hypothetical protein